MRSSYLSLLIFIGIFSLSHAVRSNIQCPVLPSSLIKTFQLCPRNRLVTLDSLPKPYATASATKPSTVVPLSSNDTLYVPQGFAVNVYLDNITSPRWLCLTPDDNVLVSLPYTNEIYLLKDTDGDGVADVKLLFANASNGLNQASGMAFYDNYFYTANTDGVLRFPYSYGNENVTGEGEVIATLPGGGNHWSRNIIITPNGTKMYVAVGSAENVGIEDLPRASVQVMNLDGTNQQTWADGLRNPNGLGFHPYSGELYTVVNERDGLGDNLVPDYFTRIRRGDFFGWPYAYLSPNNLDPRFLNDQNQSVNPELASQTITPDVLFQAHSAPLGFAFYTGSTFPSWYQNGAFVCLHGSWNRDRGTGYKIVFVAFDSNNIPTGYYEDFVDGFLVDSSIPSTWGRPVDIIVHSDGSLLFTDDTNNRIYRVQYQGKYCPTNR